MLNLNSLMFGSEQPKVLTEFYKKVVGKDPDMVDGDWSGFMCGSCFFSIGAHDKIHGKAKEPERVILNFETTEVQKEFDRIKALGATVIKEPYNPDPKDTSIMIATLADPDGNFFQLMTPWKE